MSDTKDKGTIIVPTDEAIIVPERAIVVIRTPEEFAKAVMKADPSFAKIHKSAANDYFISFQGGRRK
jgi:hypothetical protein